MRAVPIDGAVRQEAAEPGPGGRSQVCSKEDGGNLAPSPG